MQRAQTAVNPPMAPENPYDIASYPLLVVVSGPSGVGKDTLLQRLKDLGSDFWFVVTMTSRAQRPGEEDGKDYFFVTRDEFDDLIETDELLEHSLVYGEYKGIPKAQVRKALSTGKNVVMRIDVQGAEKIKRIVPDAVTIFLMPESEEELIRRLTERKTETPEGLQRRISTAREEMSRIPEFDFVVVNRAYQMNDAAADIDGIMRAERCRVGRQPIRI